MILTDFHIHSEVSQDSQAPMREMVVQEYERGVQRMCFTDHCDMVNWRSYTLREDCREIVPRAREKYAAMLESFGGAPPMDVGLGIELGEPLFAPEASHEIACSAGLDFVLGSLHILQKHGDVWFIDFHSPEHCREVYDDYLDELLEIAQLDCFDVMAHIGYPRRCMRRKGFDEELSLQRFGEKIELLLRRLIDKGHGIEINCSGIRDGCGPFPEPGLLRLYRALGGEIITVGSDAHTPETAAKCIGEGHALLRECGFGYVTVFRNRRAEFLKL